MDVESVHALDLAVEEVTYSTLERATSGGFTRVTTVVALHGDGATGRGEDVSYEAEDHEALVADPPAIDLPYQGTVRGFSERLEGANLFPRPPNRDTAYHYRRWAFESATLDLALRQAGTDLGGVLGREYRPLRFVASTRLGEPPTTDRLEAMRAAAPGIEFKLDPTSGWDADLVDDLRDLGGVRILDLKGTYGYSGVDQPPDPSLYRLVVESFPDAVIEDPAITEATQGILEGARDRVSWDAPITEVESLLDLPFEPRWLNVKPSRFGTVESLLETIAFARERDIDLYAGGQYELGVGRGQVQAVAALFFPDAPNDVAPSVYNDESPPASLPSPPLEPPADPIGFGW